VHLEVLDWGGSGPPILLLPVLGNTAHVFDHFAHPTAGYDLSTRARDLLAVADHFKFDRVILVGQSIAGDEMTKFAGMFPARARALVYLDAAYDRTKVKQLPQPVYPMPPPDAQSSAEKYTAYLARMWNWRAPQAELYNTRFVAPDGRVGDLKTALAIPAEIIKRIEAPDYKSMSAPALALYQRPNTQTAYPYYGELDAESKARADRIVDETQTYQKEAIAGFLDGATNRRTMVLDGNHYLFFTNEADVVRLVRDFLGAVTSGQ
jgi:pimeloyl-ACP methyl ester carboxylesterase